MLTSQLVDRDHTLAFHRSIFEAIQRRDAAEAERSMREHLIDVRTLLLQASHAHATERLRKSLREAPRRNSGKKTSVHR